MLKSHFVAVSLASTLMWPTWQGSRSQMPDRSKTPPIVTATEALAGTETLPVKWVRVPVPSLGVITAAIARSPGTAPFPAVVLLHGTHGFARQYVEWDNDLARGGFVAMVGCWFSGGGGAGANEVAPPIPCPEVPPLGPGEYDELKKMTEFLRRQLGT